MMEPEKVDVEASPEQATPTRGQKVTMVVVHTAIALAVSMAGGVVSEFLNKQADKLIVPESK